MPPPAAPMLILNAMRQEPELSQGTTNYRGELSGISNETWGYVILGAFILFLLLLIRRAFRRM